MPRSISAMLFSQPRPLQQKLESVMCSGRHDKPWKQYTYLFHIQLRAQMVCTCLQVSPLGENEASPHPDRTGLEVSRVLPQMTGGLDRASAPPSRRPRHPTRLLLPDAHLSYLYHHHVNHKLHLWDTMFFMYLLNAANSQLPEALKTRLNTVISTSGDHVDVNVCHKKKKTPSRGSARSYHHALGLARLV